MSSVEEKNKLVRKIFEELLENGILYANVMYQMNDDPYKMEVESWFPYFNNSCAFHVDNIFKIDECVVKKSVNERKGKNPEKVTSFNQNLYPKLPHSYHNCPLRVSTFIWEPFVVKGDDGKIDSGLEILLLKTITKQMQMKAEFKVLNRTIAAKKITDNNRTGIYADLIQK